MHSGKRPTHPSEPKQNQPEKQQPRAGSHRPESDRGPDAGVRRMEGRGEGAGSMAT